MNNRSTKLLSSIREKIGGTLKISARKVPYLLLEDEKNGGNFSICYFGKGNFFRVFRDCGLSINRRYTNFKEVQSVIKHFQELGFSTENFKKTTGSIEEGLNIFLLEPGVEEIRKYNGKERELTHKKENAFQYILGEHGTWRFVYRGDDCRICGAIQGVSLNGINLAANIVTREDMRGKHIMTNLVKEATKRFGSLYFSEFETESGKAFAKTANLEGRILRRAGSEEPGFDLSSV